MNAFSFFSRIVGLVQVVKGIYIVFIDFVSEGFQWKGTVPDGSKFQTLHERVKNERSSLAFLWDRGSNVLIMG